MVIRADLPAAQQLILVEKDRHGRVTTRETLPVRFWQLEGGEPGWREAIPDRSRTEKPSQVSDGRREMG